MQNVNPDNFSQQQADPSTTQYQNGDPSQGGQNQSQNGVTNIKNITKFTNIIYNFNLTPS